MGSVELKITPRRALLLVSIVGVAAAVLLIGVTRPFGQRPASEPGSRTGGNTPDNPPQIRGATAESGMVPSSIMDVQPSAPDLGPKDYLEIMRDARRNGRPAYSTIFAPVTMVDPVELLGIGPDSVVADVGCGTGPFVLKMLEEGIPFRKLYAVEIDKASLDFLGSALKRLDIEGSERVELVMSYPYEVALPRHSVDVVVASSTQIGMKRLRHDPATPEERVRVAASLVEVVRPGGTLHFLEPTDDGAGTKYPREWMPEAYDMPNVELVRLDTIEVEGCCLQYHMELRVREQ